MIRCTAPACNRAAVRRRDTTWWCLYHPEATPPPMDLLTGNLREPEKATRLRETKPQRTSKVTGPGRPAKVAVEAPLDGLCLREDCNRPWRHSGIHTILRTPEPPPADGLCRRIGCRRPYKHLGPHVLTDIARATTPKPPTRTSPPPALPAPTLPLVSGAEIARRYLDGEALGALAASLHIGTPRLREILREQGTRIRSRGEVIHRTPPAALDEDECRRLYATGMSTLHIAQLFHVNARRVAEILRTEGTLRPPASTSRRDNPTHLKLKLDPQTADVVRTRARDTQRTLVAYVRDLIDADLQAWPS